MSISGSSSSHKPDGGSISPLQSHHSSSCCCHSTSSQKAEPPSPTSPILRHFSIPLSTGSKSAVNSTPISATQIHRRASLPGVSSISSSEDQNQVSCAHHMSSDSCDHELATESRNSPHRYDLVVCAHHHHRRASTAVRFLPPDPSSSPHDPFMLLEQRPCEHTLCGHFARSPSPYDRLSRNGKVSF
ncbi:uncharacterized protein V1516DRAFT_667983 [Lipomyces oligophaga]|uniref:uncharacterized protein n=1 Tax=Lipomyces oligophaga TaxID=45792 RepID=UPI0034CD4D9E